MTDIKTILAHPRYREFAAAATAGGKQVLPDAFPWNLMGMTDVQIRELDLHMAGGSKPDESWLQDMILVVRAQEKLVCEYWDWWRGWEWIAARHETKLEPVAAARPPGMLVGEYSLFESTG